MPFPVAVPIELAESEREQLESWSRRHTSAQSLALRSRIVLVAAEGLKNTEIAQRLGVDIATVRKWRNRFAADRLDGLVDEPRPGQPRTITDEQVEEVIVKTLESTPKDATHWSTRLLGKHLGISDATVARAWRAYRVQPWRQGTFKFSTDPELEAKVGDVVGLYLDPPSNAIVLCVDHRHPRLDRDLEPKPPPLRLDQDRRPNPRIDRHLLRTNPGETLRPALGNG